ncbi:unnamed protein product [Choristocarpus tenellus]
MGTRGSGGANKRGVPVLVCCCGIPASGKSTFCRELCQKVHSGCLQSHRTCAEALAISKVTHVCFDDYIDDAKPVANEISGSPQVERGYVNEVVVEADASESVTLQWWHQARHRAMAAAEAEIVSAYSVPKGGESRGVHVVLLDDNMHFRSMRHEALVVARSNMCGYAQVYFPVPVGIAIERDSTREHPVTARVIEKMAASLQPPDPDRFPWESRTLNMGIEFSSGSCEGRWKRGTEKPQGECYGESIMAFLEMVTIASLSPVPSAPSSGPSLEDREADRRATTHSSLHRLDLDMRRATGQVARCASQISLPQEHIAVVMKACSASRKAALAAARQEENCLRDTLSEDNRVGSERSVPMAVFLEGVHQALGTLPGLACHDRTAIIVATEEAWGHYSAIL